MAITPEESRNINAQTQIPSRSAAVASNASHVPSAINVLSVNAEFKAVGTTNTPLSLNFSSTDYVVIVEAANAAGITAAMVATALPIADNTTVSPPVYRVAKIGDRARVYSVSASGLTGYAEFFFTGAAWQKVSV